MDDLLSDWRIPQSQIPVETARGRMTVICNEMERRVLSAAVSRTDETADLEQRRAAMALLRGAVTGILSVVVPDPIAEKLDREHRDKESSGGWRLPGMSRAEPRPVRQRPHVSVSRLNSQLKGVAAAADRMLAAARPRPVVKEARPWAEDSELVDVLYALFAAQAAAEGGGDLALAQIGVLGTALRQRHDIEVLAYDGESERHFEVDGDTDPGRFLADPAEAVTDYYNMDVSPDRVPILMEMRAADMEEIVDTPQPALHGKSWRSAFRADIESAAATLDGHPPDAQPGPGPGR